jgi:hypothetical protein
MRTLAIETRFLFSFTRLVALVSIFLLLLTGIGAMGTIIFSYAPTSIKVTSSEVLVSLEPKATEQNSSENEGTETALKGNTSTVFKHKIKLPIVVQKEFSDPSNLRILSGWLEEYPEGMHAEFIQELEEVITAAIKDEEDNNEGFVRGDRVNDAINTYKKMKIDKYNELRARETRTKQERLTALAVLAGSALLIALFSIILVLLAIERNTRRV